MLGIALLVFREVLEAALIITIVCAATRGVPGRSWYVGGGLALGVLGAVLVALFADKLADAFSGVGQEVFNAGVLLAAVGMIGWHVLWMSRHGRAMAGEMQALGGAVGAGSRSLLMLLGVVALAVLREGSEVVLFLYGMVAGGAGGVAFGLALGVSGGVVVGFALYFGLLRIPLRHFFTATNVLLIMLAAGLAAAAARYLVQADLLPALHAQLWDSSWLLSDGSLPGQTLHILIGYDATPSGLMLMFYLAVVALLSVGMRLIDRPAKPPPSARPTIEAGV